MGPQKHERADQQAKPGAPEECGGVGLPAAKLQTKLCPWCPTRQSVTAAMPHGVARKQPHTLVASTLCHVGATRHPSGRLPKQHNCTNVRSSLVVIIAAATLVAAVRGRRARGRECEGRARTRMQTTCSAHEKQ